MPRSETSVLTEPHTACEAGATIPVISCFTVATGAVVGPAAAAGAAAAVRVVRAAAITKPMPLTKSSTLTRNHHVMVRMAFTCSFPQGRSLCHDAQLLR